MIVAIEGGDAAGKNTQSKILADALSATRPTKRFAFPDYSTPTGEMILSNLKGEWVAASHQRVVDISDLRRDDAINALVLQSLMLTNRLERSADLRVAAAEGHVVLDRYIPSTMVYGEYDGLDAKWLRAVNEQLPVHPNVYVLLDAPVQEGLKRRPERRDRYETDIKRMEFVREAYLRLFSAGQAERVATGKGPRWVVVDAIGMIDEVAARVWEATR